MGNSKCSRILSHSIGVLAACSCTSLDFSDLGAGSPDAGSLPGLAFAGRQPELDAGAPPRHAEAPAVPYSAAECQGSVSPVPPRDLDCDGLEDPCEVAGECADDALVLQLLFEGTGGDASAYGNHATLSGGVSYTRGAFGQAVALTAGANATVERSASLDFTENLTVELWASAAELPRGGRVGLFDDDGRIGLFIQADGLLTCTVVGVGTASGGSVTVDTPTHVACAAEGGRMTLWQDGVIVDEVTEGTGLAALGDGPLVVGGNAPSGDRFVGWLDNLRLWSRAMPARHLQRAAARRF